MNPCINCRFFQIQPTWTLPNYTGQLGECKRRAPHLVELADKKSVTRWPRVGADSWCGDFKAKVTEDQAPEPSTRRQT